MSGRNWIESAENPLGHYDTSHWWVISQQMNGPELRDRFNKTILPKLDTDRDGYLNLEELQSPSILSGRDADAVRILTDYFSFLLDFRGGMTPGYTMALHGETLGLYAEFEKTFTRFNTRLFELTDYVEKNFNSFDTDGDKGISWEELESKVKTGSGKEKEYADFMRKWYHGFAGTNGGGVDGYSLADLAEFRRRRTKHPLLATSPEPQPLDPLILQEIEAGKVLVERPDPPRHRHYTERRGVEPRVVPPREYAIMGESTGVPSSENAEVRDGSDGTETSGRRRSYKGHGRKFNVEREDPPTFMERMKKAFDYYLGR